jgi:hypothetical protein
MGNNNGWGTHSEQFSNLPVKIYAYA